MSQPDPSEFELADEVAAPRHPWRRFFARIIDHYSCGLILPMMIAFLSGFLLPTESFDVFFGIYTNPIVFMLCLHALWLPIEAHLIASRKTTFGKWLLGITVAHRNGAALSYSAAFERTFLVMLKGNSFSLPIISLITKAVAYFNLEKQGYTSWDAEVGAFVTHQKFTIPRLIGAVLVVALISMFTLASIALDT